MSGELTLLILRILFLLILWLFLFGIVFALRSDLFGQRVRKLQADAAAGFPATPPAAAPGPTPIVPPRPATAASPMQPAPVSSMPSGANASPSGQAMATILTASRLVITSGPRQGTELSLGREPLTIGRSAESGLVIRDDYTSTHHARLLLWNDEWMIQDLDSTNGTFLNGRRVTVPTQIPLDTPIKIGTTTFELKR
ncbi:MAG TPA: FHA domain-containing protein [Microbacteriaceae bacterium]|nr:FHA domain-containing protein [Microbacteriaceae bacterium]